MAVALAGLDAKTINYPRPAELSGASSIWETARFHCWNKRGHGSLDLHRRIKYSCDVFFYQVALKTGIDRISAMAHRLGLGAELDIDIPGQRVGLVPTRDWRMSKGHPWEPGDTVVVRHRPGLHRRSRRCNWRPMPRGSPPGGRCSRTSRAASRASCSRARNPTTGRTSRLPEPMLDAVRSGMFAVVNEPGGTAPQGQAWRRGSFGRQDRFIPGPPRVAQATRERHIRQ